MMLSIAILSGLGYILSFINNVVNKNKLDVNLLFAAILVISTWSVLPLAITVICITVLIGIFGALTN